MVLKEKLILFQVFLEEMQEIQFLPAVHVQMELKFRPHLGQPDLQSFHPIFLHFLIFLLSFN